MGIQVTNAVQQPTIVYDQVLLVELSIKQHMQEIHVKAPIFHIMIIYKMFGVDQQGKRHYEADQHEIEINDYLAKALAEYSLGDPTLMRSIKANEAAIASLIQSDRGIITRVI